MDLKLSDQFVVKIVFLLMIESFQSILYLFQFRLLVRLVKNIILYMMFKVC